MYQIGCLDDIRRFEHLFPLGLVERIKGDFYQLKDWCDVDGEYSYSNFRCDLSCGMIVILDGSESVDELKSIGLSEGWEGVVPEDISSFLTDGEIWFRIVVVYTNSCSVNFFIKHLPEILEKYDVKAEQY